MDKKEMDEKTEEVRARMKAQRVLDITKGLREHDLLSNDRIDAIQDSMLNWDNEQLESMERFIGMAVEHAEMKAKLHDAKIELQASKFDNAPKKLAQEKFEQEMKKVADLASQKERLKDVVERVNRIKTDDEISPELTQKLLNANDEEITELFDEVSSEQAKNLANAMLKAGLITDESFSQQLEEIKKWDDKAIASMWERVKLFDEASTEPQVTARKWGPGSEIAKQHHNRQEAGLAKALNDLRQYAHEMEKEVVIDEPSPRKSIKEAFEEASEKQPSRRVSKPYEKRGSIKDRKEEADKKTTEEPAFITELREARKLLESYDETFTDAYVKSMSAREAMLSEEHAYDGTKIHEDTSKLRELVKANMTAQREFIVIDKVYQQALKNFEAVAVEQVSAEELNAIMENYRSVDEHTDIDHLFGGKYRSGDEPYHKWLAKRKKLLSAEEAAEMFTDIVKSFPEEAAEVFKKDKRSAEAVASHKLQ